MDPVVLREALPDRGAATVPAALLADREVHGGLVDPRAVPVALPEDPVVLRVVLADRGAVTVPAVLRVVIITTITSRLMPLLRPLPPPPPPL